MLGDASTSSGPSPKLSLHDKLLHRPGALSSGRLQEASILLGVLVYALWCIFWNRHCSAHLPPQVHI